MVTVDYCYMMACYNRWQNQNLIAAADGLSQAQRWLDQGAYFGSIAKTFNHLLVDDTLWMARFDGDVRPETRFNTCFSKPRDWDAFKQQRQSRDEALLTWIGGLTARDLEGDLSWFPGGVQELISRPKTLCLTHIFNHQTHHRGQIHCMLTALGAEPEPTDLPMMELEVV